MPVDVTMPKLTDSMEEGRIVEWKVAVGDAVGQGTVLAEIETDKAVMELESFVAGTVSELVAQNGEVVAVGGAIARIAEGAGAGRDESSAPPLGTATTAEVLKAAEVGEAVLHGEAEPEAGPRPEPAVKAAATPIEAGATAVRRGPGAREPAVPGAHPISERGGQESRRPKPPERKPGIGAAGPGKSVLASPRARKRAADLGVDLASVAGAGPEGPITTDDVEAAARRKGGATPADRADEDLPEVRFAPDEAEVEEVSFFQKASIRRVVASKHVIPHFYVTKTVRAEALLQRKSREENGSGATLTHLIMRACALALRRFPEANRSYDRGRWIRWKVVNLGLAVQTDAGLAVGVVKDVADRELAWIVEQTRGMVQRARAGKLQPEERTNATFTISNLGAFDVESFSAIINPPSSMTLAVGSVSSTPVIDGERVVPGSLLHLTLSCDHRVVDGVLAARFLGEVKALLESPEDL
jgi:pyruvate dehydrogenase E2 component (dihydrolipoamide acetyltransferase)